MLNAVGITGTGSCLPGRPISTEEIASRLGQPADALVERTGVRRRHFVEPGHSTADLAVEAATLALRRAGLQPAAVDLILVATCTPNRIMPATACQVQGAMRIDCAAAFDIYGHEAGFLSALATAQKFVQDGRFRVALVIGTDAISKHLAFTGRDGSAVLGDGAGAVVLQRVPAGHGLLGHWLRTDGAGRRTLRIPAGGSAQPHTAETLAAGLHTVQYDEEAALRFAATAFPDSVRNVLARCDLRAEDVACLVPHQCGPSVLAEGTADLAVPQERVIHTLAHQGNTLNASVPLALDWAVQWGKVRRGDVVVLSDFGAGYGWGAAALRWW